MADGPGGRFVAGNAHSNGRKAGSKNYETLLKEVTEALAANAALEAKIDDIEAHEMPLDFMLRIMRSRTLLLEQRFAAARSAAPYCHPQLQAIAHHVLDASGRPLAPVISLQAAEAIPEKPKPKLTHQGPKTGDSVQ